MTIRNIEADRDAIAAFLKAKIAPKDLQQCFEFLLANGNRPDDVLTVITLLQEGIRDQQLVACRQFVLDQPQDINLVVEIFKAIKDSKDDFKSYYDYWISKGASAETH